MLFRSDEAKYIKAEFEERSEPSIQPIHVSMDRRHKSEQIACGQPSSVQVSQSAAVQLTWPSNSSVVEMCLN